MKKKLVAILLCIFATGITFSFGGCLGSCFRSCNPVRTAPTTDGVRERIKILWDIDLPDNENLTLVNYALDVGLVFEETAIGFTSLITTAKMLILTHY